MLTYFPPGFKPNPHETDDRHLQEPAVRATLITPDELAPMAGSYDASDPRPRVTMAPGG